MKILYVVNHFKFHGGIERMLSNKIDAWSEFYQYEVIVVTLNQGNSEIVYPPKFSFRLIDLEIKNSNTKNVKDLILLFRKLNKILKKEITELLFRYTNIEFYDASFKEYHGDAIEVKFI